MKVIYDGCKVIECSRIEFWNGYLFAYDEHCEHQIPISNTIDAVVGNDCNTESFEVMNGKEHVTEVFD